LWAYKTCFKLAKFTPFQLAFGFKAILPPKLEVSTLRTAKYHGLGKQEDISTRLILLEKLDENRRYALKYYEAMQLQHKARHDKTYKVNYFKSRDFVLLLDG
jgi:hypothetical protein